MCQEKSPCWRRRARQSGTTRVDSRAAHRASVLLIPGRRLARGIEDEGNPTNCPRTSSPDRSGRSRKKRNRNTRGTAYSARLRGSRGGKFIRSFLQGELYTLFKRNAPEEIRVRGILSHILAMNRRVMNALRTVFILNFVGNESRCY